MPVLHRIYFGVMICDALHSQDSQNRSVAKTNLRGLSKALAVNRVG